MNKETKTMTLRGAYAAPECEVLDLKIEGTVCVISGLGDLEDGDIVDDLLWGF